MKTNFELTHVNINALHNAMISGLPNIKAFDKHVSIRELSGKDIDAIMRFLGKAQSVNNDEDTECD